MRQMHRDGRASGGDEAGDPDTAREVIADALLADTRRQDLLVEYARALGPDPTYAHLDDAALDDAVRSGAAAIAAATCRWLGLLAELVVRGTWAHDGAATPAAWLSWALGIGGSTAREHVRVALRLRECPATRSRFSQGTLSYSKVRAITRVATPATEHLLLDWADAAPAHVLERIIADTRRVQRAGTDSDDRDDLGVTRRWRDDGTYELILRVDAADGLRVEQAIDRLVETDRVRDAGNDEPETADPVKHTPRGRHEADLLVGAVGVAASAAPADTSGLDRDLVVIHATADDLLRAGDSALAEADAVDTQQAVTPGAGASAEAPGDRPTATAHIVRTGRGRVRAMSARALWRLACGARIDIAVDRPDGHPADLGRRRRGPTARLRRLVRERDRSCRFPGCGRTQFLDVHHVEHWADGGPTDLDNLVLLCGFHHRTVHAGWTLRAAGVGAWAFIAPNATEPHPWARRLPPASAEALTSAARAHAHDLSPASRQRLLEPRDWDGAKYDHDLTVSILTERLAAAA